MHFINIGIGWEMTPAMILAAFASLMWHAAVATRLWLSIDVRSNPFKFSCLLRTTTPRIPHYQSSCFHLRTNRADSDVISARVFLRQLDNSHTIAPTLILNTQRIRAATLDNNPCSIFHHFNIRTRIPTDIILNPLPFLILKGDYISH